MPDSPNLLFTNAGMNQFVPIFLGQSRRSAPTPPGPRRRHPEMHPRRRQAQRPRRRRPRHLSPHVLRDARATGRFGDYFKKEAIEWAWELVDRASGSSPRSASTPRSTSRRARAIPASSTRKPTILGARYSPPPARSQGPHRQRQQEGQFLDDGRNRPVRSVLGTARGPHAGRRHRGRARQQGQRPAASRSGTSSSSSSTPTRTAPSRRCRRGTSTPAWASSASPASCRAREDFTDFSRRHLELRDRHLPADSFDALERMSGRSYAARCRARWLARADLGSTGDSPVPVGDPPTGTVAGTESAGLVAQADGQVARATQSAPGADLSGTEQPAALREALGHLPRHPPHHRRRNLSPAAPRRRVRLHPALAECRYRLVAACVMPDHVHFIIQPGVKEEDTEGKPIFWPLLRT